MKATTMLRLFAVLVTGGFGLALALDSTLAGYAPTAAVFTTAAMVLMLYGWFDLRASTATKAHTDILRQNIDWLISAGAKRSADAALYVKALQEVRTYLHAEAPDAAIEIVEDALAEFHDPATAAQFCIEWLKSMGVPPMVSIPATVGGKAV
ncbi:hypothetical protein GGD67_003864 [Bradyrhizobium sp. IAR9]|uniref:hypothetical protein n=1 Tax=Bradyrhizobium sp. IAR9 TaxID=2663841 RepID=UPI0015CEB281|nr:hypothetical protein [Bradyrhizobium sp. IAR9]NYG46393.1 hypothetical protein [Bradyrhizobium sp. IAR9]